MLSRRRFAAALFLAPAIGACSAPFQAPTPTKKAAPVAEVGIAGTSKALPLLKKLADIYRQDNPAARFHFPSDVDTERSIYAIRSGQLDLAILSRKIKPEEADERVVYRPFVRDAVVFVVNGGQDLKGLTTAQVRDIYKGTITDWQQLGGPAGPIKVFDREEGDSSRDDMLIKLLGGKPKESITTVHNSAKTMLTALDTTPGAVGYSHLGLLKLQETRKVQVMALDGVMPGPESLRANAYPWTMTFGLISRHAVTPETARYRDFIFSPAGRQIIENFGYGLLEDK